jgi:hypothetical protein
MQVSLREKIQTVKKLSYRRFVKRPIGLDGTQKFDQMTRTQTVVLMAMMDLMNDQFESFYFSHDTIAQRAHCCRRSVHTALKRLKELDYIGWDTRGHIKDPKTGRKRNLTHSYYLTEKILHTLPFDVLTGEMRDVQTEEQMVQVLQPPKKKKSKASSKEPHSVQFSHSKLRVLSPNGDNTLIIAEDNYQKDPIKLGEREKKENDQREIEKDLDLGKSEEKSLEKKREKEKKEKENLDQKDLIEEEKRTLALKNQNSQLKTQVQDQNEDQSQDENQDKTKEKTEEKTQRGEDQERNLDPEEFEEKRFDQTKTKEKTQRGANDDLSSNQIRENSENREASASGLDLKLSKPKGILKTLYAGSELETREKNPLQGLRRPPPQNGAAPPQAAVHPKLREQVIRVVSAYYAARSPHLPEDKLFFWHQYEQVGTLIELVGGCEQAIAYLKFVLGNWKDLRGSTGSRDRDRLLPYPTLNQALAHFRIKIWWQRFRECQSGKPMDKRAVAVKKAREKFKRQKSQFAQDLKILNEMKSGKRPLDLSVFSERDQAEAQQDDQPKITPKSCPTPSLNPKKVIQPLAKPKPRKKPLIERKKVVQSLHQKAFEILKDQSEKLPSEVFERLMAYHVSRIEKSPEKVDFNPLEVLKENRSRLLLPPGFTAALDRKSTEKP